MYSLNFTLHIVLYLEVCYLFFFFFWPRFTCEKDVSCDGDEVQDEEHLLARRNMVQSSDKEDLN
jgi:hypothetical protein